MPRKKKGVDSRVARQECDVVEGSSWNLERWERVVLVWLPRGFRVDVAYLSKKRQMCRVHHGNIENVLQRGLVADRPASNKSRSSGTFWVW